MNEKKSMIWFYILGIGLAIIIGIPIWVAFIAFCVKLAQMWGWL